MDGRVTQRDVQRVSAGSGRVGRRKHRVSVALDTAARPRVVVQGSHSSLRAPACLFPILPQSCWGRSGAGYCPHKHSFSSLQRSTNAWPGACAGLHARVPVLPHPAWGGGGVGRTQRRMPPPGHQHACVLDGMQTHRRRARVSVPMHVRMYGFTVQPTQMWSNGHGPCKVGFWASPIDQQLSDVPLMLHA